MKFIKITDLVNRAKINGFRARLSNNNSYAEIFAPDHHGDDATYWYGATYSRADFIVADNDSGYGYNPFFYGPFHPGLCRSTDYGVQKLLNHPAMIKNNRTPR